MWNRASSPDVQVEDLKNICAASEILSGCGIGADEFTLSVYPASTPIYMELVKNGAVAKLMEAGAVVKTAFCGPCFGAGDTPADGAAQHPTFYKKLPKSGGIKINRVDRLLL